MNRPMAQLVCFVERLRERGWEMRVERMLLDAAGDLHGLASRFKFSAARSSKPSNSEGRAAI